MTATSVPNHTSVLQSSPPFSSQTQFGRRAFGPQRRTSAETLACFISESILLHRQETGQDRPISLYTDNSNLQALVQAKLDAYAMTANETSQPELRYRRVSH